MSTENADVDSVEVNRVAAERADDQRTDARAILVIFTVTVLMALHFISGWTF